MISVQRNHVFELCEFDHLRFAAPRYVSPRRARLGDRTWTSFLARWPQDLVLAILRGSVSDTNDAAWLSRQPAASPRG